LDALSRSVLATILGLAVQKKPWAGDRFTAVYSAGLGVPFVLTSLGFSKFLTFYGRFKRHFMSKVWRRIGDHHWLDFYRQHDAIESVSFLLEPIRPVVVQTNDNS
jgi:hypothetical protein